ncbi:MAG: hypothetical protein WB992_18065, partial [Bryobacteraceae bacterium]
HNTGFYGFADEKSLAEGGSLWALSGLYTAEAGPQQPIRNSDHTARFDLCASCLGPFLEQRMVACKRPGTSRRGATNAVLMPPHMKITPEETAAALRLVRLLRYGNKSYWLKFFIEWLLFRDAAETCDLSIKTVEEMLVDMKNLVNWENFLTDIRERCPSIAHHPSVAWTSKCAPTDLIPEEESEQFYELVRMWRVEHPQPEKRVLHPAGHLGREESGD